MNERIRELAIEAGEYVNSVYIPPVRSKEPGKIWEDGHVDWHTQFNQKFAELIVNECTKVLFDEAERLFEASSEEFNLKISDDLECCAEQCMDNIVRIEKHFGVE